MKEAEKIAHLKNMVAIARDNLTLDAEVAKGLHYTLKLLVNYIDFMLTPAELEDD